MNWPLRILALALILLLVGLVVAAGGPARMAPGLLRESELTEQNVAAGGQVLVFVLDSPVHPGYLAGRTLDVKPADVTHGSLVARVVRSYCSAPLVSLPVEDPSGVVDRDAYISALRSVLAYARAHPHVRVIVNVSLGSYESDLEERELVRRLDRAGVLVVAAAGNDDTREPMYPAAHPGVVAVASATPQGKALSSNYGPHITISASGDITFIDYEFLPYERLWREMQARGTSFAAPRVSAALAYVLQKRRSMSPAGALALVMDLASPIAGEHFERGELGAGLLDIYRVKCRVHPLYRWLHRGLPVVLGLILAAFTVFVCLRHGVVGVFVSLLVWVVGVPAGVLFTVEFGRYLEFVGSGYRYCGPAPFLVAGAAVLGCAFLVRLNARIMLWAWLPAGALGLLMALGGLPAGERAAAASACAVALTALAEVRIRRELSRIRSVASAASAAEAASYLARAYERAADERVRAAARQVVLQLPADEAAERLAHERRHQRGAAALLEAIRTAADAVAAREAEASGGGGGV